MDHFCWPCFLGVHNTSQWAEGWRPSLLHLSAMEYFVSLWCISYSLSFGITSECDPKIPTFFFFFLMKHTQLQFCSFIKEFSRSYSAFDFWLGCEPHFLTCYSYLVWIQSTDPLYPCSFLNVRKVKILCPSLMPMHLTPSAFFYYYFCSTSIPICIYLFLLNMYVYS